MTRKSQLMKFLRYEKYWCIMFTIDYLFLFRKKISISLLVNMQSVYSREDSSVGKEVVKGGIFVN